MLKPALTELYNYKHILASLGTDIISIENDLNFEEIKSQAKNDINSVLSELKNIFEPINAILQKIIKNGINIDTNSYQKFCKYFELVVKNMNNSDQFVYNLNNCIDCLDFDRAIKDFEQITNQNHMNMLKKFGIKIPAEIDPANVILYFETLKKNKSIISDILNGNFSEEKCEEKTIISEEKCEEKTIIEEEIEFNHIKDDETRLKMVYDIIDFKQSDANVPGSLQAKVNHLFNRVTRSGYRVDQIFSYDSGCAVKYPKNYIFHICKACEFYLEYTNGKYNKIPYTKLEEEIKYAIKQLQAAANLVKEPDKLNLKYSQRDDGCNGELERLLRNLLGSIERESISVRQKANGGTLISEYDELKQLKMLKPDFKLAKYDENTYVITKIDNWCYDVFRSLKKDDISWGRSQWSGNIHSLELIFNDTLTLNTNLKYIEDQLKLATYSNIYSTCETLLKMDNLKYFDEESIKAFPGTILQNCKKFTNPTERTDDILKLAYKIWKKHLVSNLDQKLNNLEKKLNEDSKLEKKSNENSKEELKELNDYIKQNFEFKYDEDEDEYKSDDAIINDIININRSNSDKKKGRAQLRQAIDLAKMAINNNPIENN